MIDIRQLTNDDVNRYDKELTEYMYMCLSENDKEIDGKLLAKKYYQDMIAFTEDGSAVILGAFDGNKLIGFHWGYVLSILGKQRMHSYFNGILPEYRGQKIGSNFFRMLEKITVERGIDTIEAMCSKSNPIAVDYHLHNGFEIEKYKVVKKL